jgi:hypothetical protein
VSRIYVASSWRNPLQQDVVRVLRDAGHEVYDFRNPKPGDKGFGWSQLGMGDWRDWSPADIRDALQHPRAQAGFKSDHDAMEWADTFVMVLPCGRSAHLELGWACGAGKRALILQTEKQEPELMYLEAERICVSIDELLAALDPRQVCGNCETRLPEGCGGIFRDDGPACALNHLETQVVTKRLYSIDAPDQPRLKVARAEIEAVLRKHDLAGVMVLHTPGMTEFFYDIRPTYSCVWIDEQIGMLRVKSKLSNYDGDAQAQRHDQAASANMLRALAQDLNSAAAMFLDTAAIADRALRAEHTDRSHVPDPMEGKPQ